MTHGSERAVRYILFLHPEDTKDSTFRIDEIILIEIPDKDEDASTSRIDEIISAGIPNKDEDLEWFMDHVVSWR